MFAGPFSSEDRIYQDAFLTTYRTFLAGPFSSEDRIYQDAFLTTYRTFLTPDELVEKLLYRYHKFITRSTTHREEQTAASSAFSFLVCVVEDLSISELTTELLKILSDFQHELLCKADFKMAKMLRTSLVKKLEARKRSVAGFFFLFFFF